MIDGLEIRNGNDVLIIDKNYVTLCLATSITVNEGNTWTYYDEGAIWHTDVAYTNTGASMPLVFINVDTRGNTSAGACIAGLYNNGSDGHWNVRIAAFGTQSQTIRVYIFDRPVPKMSGRGFEVFNPETGVCVFSADYKPLVLAAFGAANNLPNGTWAAAAYGGISYLEQERDDGYDSLGNVKISYTHASTMTGIRSTTTGCVEVSYTTDTYPGRAPDITTYTLYDSGGASSGIVLANVNNV